MNKEFDKIVLAAEMIVEAAREFKSGGGDISYVKSILLAGAANNIVSPYLHELGIDCLYVELSKFAATMDGVDFDDGNLKEQKKAIGRGMNFYRFTYNSLKHAGHDSRRILPSQDLVFVSDLEEEADSLINASLVDFFKLPVSSEYSHDKLPPEFLALMSAPWNPKPPRGESSEKTV